MDKTFCADGALMQQSLLACLFSPVPQDDLSSKIFQSFESCMGETEMKTIMATAFAVILCSTGVAHAEGCNIADVHFGKVRIELISHQDYETGIIFGNDFDSQRFSYYKILGQVASPERDGSRSITNVNGEVCGLILRDMSIDTSDANCEGCSKTPINLRKVAPNSYVVMLKGGSIVGTIEGRLNK